LPDDESAIYCYEVEAGEASAIQAHVEHKIDLERYRYFVECLDPTGSSYTIPPKTLAGFPTQFG